ncbi:hypothetical protein SAMN06265221_12421 [Paracoccus laeviglucosivorans]|uniref:Uncharacterized protein n=1 Tax=Paracoccus laeviglucosivorans TaxID=1197861 RepID=A0A521FJM2_9RHOB|nr:hypothetical protein SAMN06265221_12421 [Paracoccus laeviglucosivorans]
MKKGHSIKVALTDARTGRTEIYTNPPWSLLALNLTIDGCSVTLVHSDGGRQTVHVNSSFEAMTARFSN